MSKFIHENFLLTTRTARRLYHDHAARMPIYDFHCHLPVKDIAENKRFRNLTEAWLGGDHYKWRALRASGVAERLITGDAPDREKFMAWAAIVPSTIGNPLYHWTHLELARYFEVSRLLLGPDTGQAIYDRCSSLLSGEAYRVRPLLTMMNVKVLATTDDPIDSLEHHATLRADHSFSVTVVPTFRPDAAMAVDNPPAFSAWAAKLGRAAGMEIRGWRDFLEALRKRHEYFHANGCRASDHAWEEPYADECSDEEADRIFQSARAGQAVSAAEARTFKSALMIELARMNARQNWVQQLHIGALRDINSRAFSAQGPNTGYDTIGDLPIARPLARYLDRLDSEGLLPKTILFCLNPAHNQVLAAMIGGFPKENLRGRMQFGPAWWFNDQRHGMEEQMKVLADMGLLARFVGMVTDSRSFLSFPRHEYFRRILCEMLGLGVQRGEIPADFSLLGGMVRDICCNNAEEFFALPQKVSSADTVTRR
jgi:glucuronate isomerase